MNELTGLIVLMCVAVIPIVGMYAWARYGYDKPNQKRR